MTQAQIVNDVVHWLATDVQAAAYPPGILQFVAVPAGLAVQEGWSYDPATNTFSPPPAPSSPPMAPMALTPIQLITLLETAGGMTDAQVAAFAVDATPAIVAIRFKFGLATSMMPTDPAVTAGLAALQAANYLSAAGAAAVAAQWPMVVGG